jgi:hypothetical protein
MGLIRKSIVYTAFAAAAYGAASMYVSWYDQHTTNARIDADAARAAINEMMPHIVRLHREFEKPGNPYAHLWRETNAAIADAQRALLDDQTHPDKMCPALWGLQSINMQTGTQHVPSKAAEEAYKKCAAYIFGR